MHFEYFPDTDTLSVDFRENRGPVSDTVDGPDEDFLLEFDAEGRLVGMTIEHASERLDLDHLQTQPQFHAFGDEVRSAS